MKTSSLLLTVSVVANLALAVALFRAPTAPSASRADSAAAAPKPAATAPTGSAEAIKAALASGDAAALQAAGFAPDVANDIVFGRAFARFADKMRAAQSASTNSKWWRRTGGSTASQGREQLLAARRELSEAMIAAFGDDMGLGGSDHSQLAFLPAGKRDALRRITQDYEELMAKFGGDGIQLASDREKLKLLRAERDRDIAALLSPDEMAAYEMRTSATAASVRQRYGDGIESEDDFRKVYALQKAYDEKFPALAGRITPDMMTARADATRQLQDDLKAALGLDKYNALRRASDNDLRTLDGLAARLNLPTSATDNVVAVRDAFASESQRINNDASLTPAQRREQITALGNRARNDVARTLGSEGTDAYAQRSSWLNMLQNGMAFSTTPPVNGPGALSLGGTPTQSVYPVMPAGGPAGAGAVRQMVVNGVATSDISVGGGGSSGGVFMIPAERAIQRDNVQVMTFTAAADAPAPAVGTVTITPAPTGGGSSAGTPVPAPRP